MAPLTGMPSYISLVSGAVGLSLALAVLAPAPRIALHRAASACRLLMFGGVIALVVAALMPAFDVWYPAIAVSGAALVLWFTMFWLARQPALWDSGHREEADQNDGDDDSDGGGGGGPPDDRGPDPDRGSGPSTPLLDWEAFDRERRAWERDRRRDRMPVSV